MVFSRLPALFLSWKIRFGKEIDFTEGPKWR